MNLPKCIWFTGLSGAGKTTIAQAVRDELLAQGRRVYVLDGDLLRTGLNRDLGFSDQDRSENTRRVAEVARLMVDAGVTVLVALISPFEEDRRNARALFAQGQFFEVYVDAPLLVCMRRDVKGLYAKAQQGNVPAMTGMGSPYQPPGKPDLWLETGVDTLDNCVRQVLALVAGNSDLTMDGQLGVIDIVATGVHMEIAIRIIGNSKGVVIPKLLLSQAGLEDQATANIVVEKGCIVLSKLSKSTPSRTTVAR